MMKLHINKLLDITALLLEILDINFISKLTKKDHDFPKKHQIYYLHAIDWLLQFLSQVQRRFLALEQSIITIIW